MKRIGIIGCGNISGTYLKNLTELFSDRIEIAGICDLIPEKEQSRAKQYGISKIYEDCNELFADPTVDIVMNLTRPIEHFNISVAALNSGKHVYTEKPLGVSFDEGMKLRNLAKSKKLLIGGAPDTFLGAGLQTCRKLIDDGHIGDVIGASAFMTGRGPESWHPDPEFFYKFGGGPMLDMGPYYITALISLLGAVKCITGAARASFPTRLITSQPKDGTIMQVDVPTHYTGIMEFVTGAIGTITTSFDIHAAELPRIEIYGSDGTINVPDPNYFGGPIRVWKPDCGSFVEVPLQFKYEENSRGLGLYDMVCHIEDGAPFRASGDLLFHALEVMTGFERAYKNRAFVDMTTAPNRPEAMVQV